MKVLGIDYGLSKVGLAASEGEIASPLGTESRVKNYELRIRDLCREQGVTKIVLGVSEGQMAKIQKNFGRKLEKITGLPVVSWDETLTSKEAVKKMIESQRGRQKRKAWEHAVSAALILQDWLDFQKR